MLLASLFLIAAQSAQAGPTRLAVEGAFKEPLSGMEFPIAKDKWFRTQVLSYSEAPRLNHSITYELRNGDLLPVRASIYVFPNEDPVPDNLEIHFDSALREVSRIGRGYLLSKKFAHTFERDGRKHEAFFGLFLFQGGKDRSEIPTVEQLYIVKEGTYWIKWRITSFKESPANLTDLVLDLIDDFLPKK